MWLDYQPVASMLYYASRDHQYINPDCNLPSFTYTRKGRGYLDEKIRDDEVYASYVRAVQI